MPQPRPRSLGPPAMLEGEIYGLDQANAVADEADELAEYEELLNELGL